MIVLSSSGDLTITLSVVCRAGSPAAIWLGRANLLSTGDLILLRSNQAIFYFLLMLTSIRHPSWRPRVMNIGPLLLRKYVLIQAFLKSRVISARVRSGILDWVAGRERQWR